MMINRNFKMLETNGVSLRTVVEGKGQTEMATPIRMKHKTGIHKTGYFGFSWTSLFWGGFPAIFRGDILYGAGILIISFLLGAFTLGIGAIVVWVVWACVYNKNYTERLLQDGYEFDDTPAVVAEAKRSLNIA